LNFGKILAKIAFSFDVRIISHLGSNSISNDYVAILELLKNSRDASSKQVVVTIDTAEGSLSVKDDGTGMSSEDIRNVWMVIGTTYRLKNGKNSNGEVVSGEKGIGRLACQKLGSKMTLTSLKGKEKSVAAFDWSKFEAANSVVSDIEFDLVTEKNDSGKSGTEIKITNLHSIWTQEMIRKLQNEIALFFHNPAKKGMKIFVGDEDQQIPIDGSFTGLRNEYSAKCPFSFSGEFDSDGITKMQSRNLLDRNPVWKDMHTDIMPRTQTELGPFTFKIYHFPKTLKNLPQLEKHYEKNSITPKNLTDFLAGNSGVFIFRDDVWMIPYGGKNDWLELEAKRIQDSDRIGLSQVSAEINFSRLTNPNIEPAAHRETIIDNESFQTMKAVMHEVFLHVRNFMVEIKDNAKAETRAERGTAEQQTEFDDRKSQVTYLKNSFVAKLPASDRSHYKAIVSDLETGIEEMEEKHDKKISDLEVFNQTMIHLASIGLASSSTAKNTGSLFEQTRKIVNEGRSMHERIIREKGNISQADLERGGQMIQEMYEILDDMSSFMSFVEVLETHISKSNLSKKRKSQVDVGACIQTVIDGLVPTLREHKIDIEHKFKKLQRIDGNSLRIKIDRIDLETVTTQFLLNSIDTTRSKRAGREIRLEYSYDKNNNFVLEIIDSGHVIKNKKKIWDQFNSLAIAPDENGPLHALRFLLVKKIVDSYGGTCEFVDTEKGNHAVVRIPNISLVV
jgi:signal transduction histidine kinase